MVKWQKITKTSKNGQNDQKMYPNRSKMVNIGGKLGKKCEKMVWMVEIGPEMVKLAFFVKVVFTR